MVNLTDADGSGCWSRSSASSGAQSYPDVDGSRSLLQLSVRPPSCVDGVCGDTEDLALGPVDLGMVVSASRFRRVQLGDNVQRISGICKLWSLLRNLLHKQLLEPTMQKGSVEVLVSTHNCWTARQVIGDMLWM
jgi:hypothetical protein